MSQILLEIVIIVMLLVLNGVLAMAEMSLVSARKARLRSMAEEGDKSAAVALELAKSPNQFLSTVQIGITLVGILAGAFGGATVAEWLASRFVAVGLPEPYSEPAGIVIVVVGITYLSLIIGELVPKRLALAAPERFASAVAGPMQRLSSVASPVVRFLGWSSDVVLRVLGAEKQGISHVTDDEVRMLMEEGTLAGVFHNAEPKMVERVLELDELSVHAIMTPRPNVVFVNKTDPQEQLRRRLIASGHSYFPVYEANRDHVVGVVSIKAIYANFEAGTPASIAELMKEPLFVPETQSVVQLLESFRQTGKHFAVVVDEFGSVVGVVTLVDVLESIVGDVPSQEQAARPEIRQREDGSWIVDGTTEIETLEERVPELRFGDDEDRLYQTVAGFVLDELGHVPAEGEAFDTLGWHFEVIDMDRQRIDKVLLRRATAQEQVNG